MKMIHVVLENIQYS